MTAATKITVSPEKAPLVKKPLLLFNCCPVEGHLNPQLVIAKYLASRGYGVSMLCPPIFEDRFENTGIELIPWKLDFQLNGPKHIPPEIVHLPTVHLDRRIGEFTRVFMSAIPSRMKLLVETLEMLREREPGRQIIVLDDCANTSAMPLIFGAPLPDGFDQRPKLIGVNPASLPVESRDTAPFFLGLPPDSTESGRLRNKALYSLMKQGPMRTTYQTLKASLEESGCTTLPTGDPISAQYTCYDATIQLCAPSMEYYRSDLPSNIHFVGTLPGLGTPPSFQHPSWWSDVSENKDKKKIVFVSQGTVNPDQSELIKPTLKALSNRPDILTIVTFGFPGASLEPDIPLPPNARVIDYLPYAAILPFTDVFVSNAGYGALTHAVTHGVPVVFGGESQEKTENAMRAAVIGLGRNLYTQTPKARQVREAVDQVLQNPSYKKRAMELKEENEKLNSLKSIENLVESMIE